VLGGDQLQLTVGDWQREDERAAQSVNRGLGQGQKRRFGPAADSADYLHAASAPSTFSMKLRLCAFLLALPLSAAAQGTAEAPLIAEFGPHHSIWTWTTIDWDESG
jgi:hypothetical protein